MDALTEEKAEEVAAFQEQLRQAAGSCAFPYLKVNFWLPVLFTYSPSTQFCPVLFLF